MIPTQVLLLWTHWPPRAVDYYLGGASLILALILFVLRRRITYLYCPHFETWTENVWIPKSFKILLVHFVVTSIVATSVFVLLAKVPEVSIFLNENNLVRIISFLALFILFFLPIGLVVDRVLEMTDPIFKEWKSSRRH